MGIDDPVAWFNAAPSSVVSAWQAFYAIENDGGSGQKVSAKDAAKILGERYG